VQDAVTLLWISAVHILLTTAPLVAVVLFAVRRGVRDVPLLLAIGLFGSGAVAIASFWAYFAAPFFGRMSRTPSGRAQLQLRPGASVV
jgi:hypothetical protein